LQTMWSEVNHALRIPAENLRGTLLRTRNHVGRQGLPLLLQASEVAGASITAAKTRRSNGKREAGDESSTLYKVGEMQNHPSGRWLD